MKKIIGHFIKYPIAVNVIVIAFILFGLVGAKKLNSSFFPLIDSKIITIQLNYPGASPQEMEEGVVLKIENNLKGIVGVDRFTSKSSENSATITVETEKGYDINVLLAEVKNAVDKVPSFPTGMEPPVVSKVEQLQSVLSFVISGDKIPLMVLKNTARDIETELRQIEGISQVNISGFPLEEIEIAVLENKLKAYNISFNEVSAAISKANLLITGGSVKTSEEEYLIRARNRQYYADKFEYIIVKASENGNVVYLRDVAQLSDKWAENPNRSYLNGDQSVKVDVNTTNSENYLNAAFNVKAFIEDYNETHSDVQLTITSDRSVNLVQRTKLLTKNGIMGVVLILIFLSLFLKPRIALWVAFGLPISFLGFFMVASYFGVTINVLSLFGLIIVLGILVDDGIVIGENIYHHFEMGKTRVQAAVHGVLEVVPPIVSAILTTIIAFSVFFYLDGRLGEFMSEVGTVVIITLTLSLFEALVILPSHLAHSRALTKEQKTYVFNRIADMFISRMRDKLYAPVITFFMKNKFLGIAIPFSLLIITIGAMNAGIIKFTFFPNVASDRIQISLNMPQGTSEEITRKVIDKIETAAFEVNESFIEKQSGGKDVIQNIVKRVGPGTSNATLTLNLLTGEERDFAADVIANAVEKKVGPVPEAENLNYGSGSNFGGRPVSVALLSNNIAELRAAKQELKAVLAKESKLKNVTDTDPEGIKEIQIVLNEKAHMLGLTLGDVMSQVRSGFFGLQVQRFQRGQDEVKVWVRFEREARSSMQNLYDMRIRTPYGGKVPLAEIAEFNIERGEITISHLDGKREIRVEADMKSRKESATEAIAHIQDNILPGIMIKYPSVSSLFEGQNREASKVQASAKAVIPAVLFLIYAVIAFTFRSYSKPLLLILMLPISLIGVGWGHFFHGQNINMLSFLGIIALLGIVVNDGLVLIEKFNFFLREGLKFEEALIAAGKSRFRAIFLTSITTVAGLAPLIFETSRQAQFLIPMAISVAYGITIATFLTLLLLPLFISITNQIKVHLIWLWTGEKPSRESVERVIIELNIKHHELD
ncbi:efflux RND transporter permease subunit [Bacteroidales bacterium]|nr:efflux RND transporter permease subunit [Bacteroidales bacterium]